MAFGFGENSGISFSIKRLFGVSGAKNSLSRRTGIPTTRDGMYRKEGKSLLESLFKWTCQRVISTTQ